ncbi:putative ABC transporter ATP-binding protein/MT1014 [bacterium BMS3Abin04]|nr:putative ABC transporter ATP-binding protein/MT1014 [bacterium BMS3Abin04]
MEKSFIQIDNLLKYFESAGEVVYAIADISFTVDKGDFVTIMGPSGSGKSTLLTMLGGLSRPSSGKIIVDMFDIYSLTNKQLSVFRREFIGFVFQSFQLIPYLTVKENILVPLLTKKLTDKEQNNKAAEVLEWVKLSDKMNRLSHELSGGEQQRVAIARALVNDPPIILADEPTGNLDAATGNQILDVLKDLNNAGKTIIIVTHNEVYRFVSDYNINLMDGKLVQEKQINLIEVNGS